MATFRITETEFAKLKFLFSQPKQCWTHAMNYPQLTDGERQIIRAVLSGELTAADVIKPSAVRLKTGVILSKSQIKELYVKGGSHGKVYTTSKAF
jgi:hypothetical protein